jgi:TRAP-type uncharacterized transport system substrate-binding protein
MDKAMKGLVTGDLSSFAVKQIEKTIEAHLPKMELVQREIEKLEHSKNFYSGFNITENTYRLNAPNYKALEVSVSDPKEALRKSKLEN